VIMIIPDERVPSIPTARRTARMPVAAEDYL
jgi:hypothetical protein